MSQKIVLNAPSIVFLTAFATTAFKSHVLRLGVTQVFEKPIQIENLRDLLDAQGHS
jgi:hypothetical protein